MADKTTQVDDPVEIIEPGAQVRVVTLGTGDLAWTLEQRPLNFFQKLELFSILGAALDKALSGDDPLSLNELLDVPELPEGEEFDVSQVQGADQFIRGIAKLVQYAPELILDLYCVVLNVPRGRRDMAKSMMQESVEDGGLSDDDGFGILETFVDQNWEVLKDFFSERILPLVAKMKSSDSDPSKPSSPTPARTRKQSKNS